MLTIHATLALESALRQAQEIVRARPSPTVPLAWRGGYLCVPVTLGKEGVRWFVLDTGAAQSTLSRDAYAGLLAQGERPKADGTLVAQNVALGEYRLGNLPLHPETFELTFTSGGKCDGVLGMDFLGRYRVGLDVRDKSLRLWPREIPSETATREWFAGDTREQRWSSPLILREEGLCVAVELGNLTVPMVLDTGASSTFVHTDIAAMLQGARRKKESKDVGFFDGVHRARFYDVRAVGLGGQTLGPRVVGAAGVSRMVGLLGRDLFAPLRLLLDYPDRRVQFSMARPELAPEMPPALDGPRFTLASGVVVRWPLGVVVQVPPGCAFDAPPGYREVYKEDESVVLVPPRAGVMTRAPLDLDLGL